MPQKLLYCHVACCCLVLLHAAFCCNCQLSVCCLKVAAHRPLSCSPFRICATFLVPCGRNAGQVDIWECECECVYFLQQLLILIFGLSRCFLPTASNCCATFERFFIPLLCVEQQCRVWQRREEKRMLKKTKKSLSIKDSLSKLFQLSISVTIDIIRVRKSSKVRWQESEKESP